MSFGVIDRLRVFTGRMAKEIGLVDELGSFEKAVEIARKLAKAPKAKIYEVKPKRSFLQKLLGEEGRETFSNLARILNGQVESFNLMYLLN